MGRSSGAGSPVWFVCWACRSSLVRNNYTTVRLTGRTKPYRARKGHALGIRSTNTLREYECSCGHIGWSNHIDLERLEDTLDSIEAAIRASEVITLSAWLTANTAGLTWKYGETIAGAQHAD